MSKEMAIIILGLMVFIAPYLGVPSVWRVALITLLGLAIMIVGFLLRGEVLFKGINKSKHGTFVESTPVRMRNEQKEEIKNA